jgi:membrane protease subunit HflC
MRSLIGWLFVAIVFVVFLAVSGVFYVVPETEQVILTQFGQPVGGVVRDAGLHFKVPFMQTVNRFDKRVLQWDGPASEMPTKDKLYIVVDNFARWRIADPLQFFLRMRDERSALSRLDDIIGSETRNTVARHQLVELIRTTKDREPLKDESLVGVHGATITSLSPIVAGRVVLEKEVTAQSKEKLAEFGIELLDVSFMRINYNPAVASKIYERMVSERRQIAERFRSEGMGAAAKILGTRERDLKQIESEAYRQVQTVQGKADAEAMSIYAEAFNQNPEAREFFSFQRSLETYRTSFQSGTTVVLSTSNGFLRHLNGDALTVSGTGVPAAASTAPAAERAAPPRPPALPPANAPKPPAPPPIEAPLSSNPPPPAIPPAAVNSPRPAAAPQPQPAAVP